MAELIAHVDVIHTEVKIGDTLCVLPLVTQLAETFGTKVHLTGAIADSVKPLLANLPVLLSAPAVPPAINLRIDIQAAYDHGRATNQHMATAIGRLAGWPVSALPVSLDLACAALTLPAGIVISPFSGSRQPWYKAWPTDRWLAVVRLLAAHGPDPVYVVGAAGDDVAAFADAGAVPLVGLTLPHILNLLRASRLFISIDNGLSHLAHFGGVERHLLLYPALLPPNLVVNPRARVVRGRPEDIEVAHVVHHLLEALQSLAESA